jgi:hypothetical protein
MLVQQYMNCYIVDTVSQSDDHSGTTAMAEDCTSIMYCNQSSDADIRKHLANVEESLGCVLPCVSRVYGAGKAICAGHRSFDRQTYRDDQTKNCVLQWQLPGY